MRSGEAAALVVLALGAAAGCADQEASGAGGRPQAGPVTTRSAGPVATTPKATPGSKTRPAGSRAVSLSVPAIGVRGLAVIAYAGTPDDAAGDRIQDRGRAASPRGPRGGVGPGQVGNFIVTGHRTEAGRPFGRLPSVRTGNHVLVSTGGLVYDYLVTGTLRVSFRKPAERASQRAAVPGRAGVAATRPMITLSTCATPEDHAAGNYWADALGNPEHRIDKIGVLVAVRPAS